jgi:hypothetical protein
VQEQLDLAQVEFRELDWFPEDEEQLFVELQWCLSLLPVQKLLTQSALLVERVELAVLSSL